MAGNNPNKRHWNHPCGIPFQFKPLMRFLNSQYSERLLIADNDGKTIETKIVLKELLRELQPFGGKKGFCRILLV